MNWDNVKALTFNNKAVKKLELDGVTKWEKPASFTNALHLAINTDGTPYIGTNGERGYKTGWRVNSSNVEKESEHNCMTGYIPVKANDVIRVKNTVFRTGNGYFHWYTSNFQPDRAPYYESYDSGTYNTKPNADGIIEFNAPNSTSLAYFRFTTGIIDETSIITINEEIPV